ncbi:helix-turn-helix transcriptional regulator [Sphingobium herbicidovorans]|nr:transcriptional regulator [Sphingobium sp. MI1205]
MINRARTLERQATAMTIVVALQALATLFFLVDFAGDMVGESFGRHVMIEGAAAIALLAAVVLGALHVRSLVVAARQDEIAVAIARGAAAELIQLRFAQWKLTKAEADVALFALKGCDVHDIAQLRGAAAGTVRAQLTRVYAKAGVGSQSSLIALFLEELIDPAMLRSDADQKTVT